MGYRVAFVTTHPIQYQAPVFRCLHADPEVSFEALFCTLPAAAEQGTGFGVAFQWDLPLLEGYAHRVLNNIAPQPSVVRFDGCDTPDIRETLVEGQYDAVVVNGWVVKSCLQTLKACRSLGIPCLVRGEANLLRKRAFWKGWLQRLLVNRFDGCLAIGAANRDFYLARGVPEEKLFSASYCIENERFARSSGSAAIRARRESWGAAEDEVCLLFSGKLVEKKHPLTLIRAFRDARAAGARARLVIVGDGELRAECEREAAGLPVVCTGFLNQSEIPEVYHAADCLVLPSDAGETWGLVVNEAMAAGRPAIVSDLVGCRADLIEEDRTGWSFPCGDATALAHALTHAADLGRDGLAERGAAARERVQSYSPEVAASGIVAAVREVVARSNRPRAAQPTASREPVR